MTLVTKACAFDLVGESGALNQWVLVLEVEVLGESVLAQYFSHRLQNIWIPRLQGLLCDPGH